MNLKAARTVVGDFLGTAFGVRCATTNAWLFFGWTGLSIDPAPSGCY